MSLLEQRGEGLHRVRWVREDAIATDAGEQAASFHLMPDGEAQPWAPRSVDAIDEAAIAELLARSPALVVLGTGARQILPPPRVLAAFLQRGIGLEAMDNHAAARTYNLLADEGRRVLVAFLLPD